MLNPKIWICKALGKQCVMFSLFIVLRQSCSSRGVLPQYRIHLQAMSPRVTILCQERVLPFTNLIVQGTGWPTMGEMRWGRLHPRPGCKFYILWFSSIPRGNKHTAPCKTVPLFWWEAETPAAWMRPLLLAKQQSSSGCFLQSLGALTSRNPLSPCQRWDLRISLCSVLPQCIWGWGFFELWSANGPKSSSVSPQRLKPLWDGSFAERPSWG